MEKKGVVSVCLEINSKSYFTPGFTPLILVYYNLTMKISLRIYIEQWQCHFKSRRH